MSVFKTLQRTTNTLTASETAQIKGGDSFKCQLALMNCPIYVPYLERKRCIASVRERFC